MSPVTIAQADNPSAFTYADTSSPVVSDIKISADTINTKDQEQSVNVQVSAYDKSNPFVLAVAEFVNEGGTFTGFTQAQPVSVSESTDKNIEYFNVDLIVPKTFPEGQLFLVLRLDVKDSNGAFWRSTLNGPTSQVPAALPLPAGLPFTLNNSYSATPVAKTSPPPTEISNPYSPAEASNEATDAANAALDAANVGVSAIDAATQAAQDASDKADAALGSMAALSEEVKNVLADLTRLSNEITRIRVLLKK